ncbi:uncharacterized protein LOC115737597 [Rhodamnia argentea]|uniref:Uncharacterized protein LOC115737597 n=1 Tax=Rhodamnia argentea TaxID=178133 RepID=A0A8B8NSZ1_9MYRT|nr:uncharacterized protein LOC115737597 [Rhodamnia argentea]
MATETSREERRRKIVDRGSDRLALITGRTPSPPHDQFAGGIVGGDHAVSSRSSKEYVNAEASAKELPHVGESFAETNLRKSEISGHHIQAPLMQRIPTGSQSSSSSKQKNQPRFFSSKRLNSCVIESENTRACCALIIAVLVVLSCSGYPIVAKSDSVISSRPLYILLVTDATIVLVRMYLDMQRNAEESVDESGESQEDSDNWGGAVKVLERGLAVYQTVRGVFIDCSVYMAIVICCLSVV